jgi:sugar lactone lactonase YvrE
MRAHQVTDPLAHHAEGPVWWEAWGGLKYVDMMAGDVLTLHQGGTVDRVHVGRVAAALRPRAGGGAVVGLERALGLAGRDDLTDLAPLPEVWSDRGIRFNDGGCDPDGRFYCGSMAYDQAPGAGSMFRLAADGSGGYATEQMWSGVTVSNGFAFSPDGSLAYYNDTPTHQVSVWDYDREGGLGPRRPLVTVDLPDISGPDGLCVDAEGYVWTAIYGGSVVHRYSPDGRLDGVVELPVRQVTACTFGGPDLDELFITTSRENLPVDEQPQAGSVFSVKPGVTGQRTIAFAG